MNRIKKNLKNLKNLSDGELYRTLGTLNAEADEEERSRATFVKGFNWIVAYLDRQIARCRAELSRRARA
jgi:hypothetical protein